MIHYDGAGTIIVVLKVQIWLLFKGTDFSFFPLSLKIVTMAVIFK